jgi:glycosyltransferase involved in cell wall biosynthesis
VTNEQDAILVPRDNPAAVREALHRVINDRDLAQRLVANGSRTYESHFTKEAFVGNVMALYERMILSAGVLRTVPAPTHAETMHAD